jgi:hypothetical protein
MFCTDAVIHIVNAFYLQTFEGLSQKYASIR